MLSLKDFKFTPALELIDDERDVELFTDESMLKPDIRECRVCERPTLYHVQLAEHVFTCCPKCEKELLNRLTYELIKRQKCTGIRALMWDPCNNPEQLKECTDYIAKLHWIVGVSQTFENPGVWTAAAMDKSHGILTTMDEDMMTALSRAIVMVLLIFESGRKKAENDGPQYRV